MTAHAMKGDRERCLAAGMDGYVSKPISSQELEEAIAGVLLARDDREAVSNLEAKPAKSRSVMTWNMDDTLERLGGDQQLFHEIIEIFLDDLPKHMAALGQAITDGNTEAIEQVAHTLKGELGYLGISEVSRKAREMEEFGQTSEVRLAASLYATFEAGTPRVTHLHASNPGIKAWGGDGYRTATGRSMMSGGEMNVNFTEFERPGSSCDRVLVAEDDTMFRRILQSWLENWGYRVTLAADGARAWTILQQELPPNYSSSIG